MTRLRSRQTESWGSIPGPEADFSPSSANAEVNKPYSYASILYFFRGHLCNFTLGA